MVEFHRRCGLDFEARTAVSPNHSLTPRAETATEVSLLWGLEEKRVRHELNVALFLEQHFPVVWALCLAGQLDAYRAGVIADHVRHAVSDPVQLKQVAQRLTEFLERHLSDAHGVEGVPPVVVCTSKQLRNKLDYEVRRLQPAEADRRHREAKARRSVQTTELPDGMAHLGVTATVDQVRIAERRLTLAAKQQREQGDERTLAQLRSDLAMDLLCGREEGVPVPRYARPVIVATVPVQTLMGVSDDPGLLSGGTPITAGHARAIALQPGSTWYRMLTDPAGGVVELSTTSYKPTAPIWREVVATWESCFEPTCTAPAAEAELDHRIEWPRGETTPGNLWPGCKRGHTAKHAPGFSVQTTTDGSFVLRTRAGFEHPIAPPARPATSAWPEMCAPVAGEVQFSATELLDALAELRDRRDQERAEDLERDRILAWEHGLLPERFVA
nr:HNH endonuclease signature motif containing protein [Nocardioides panaciterrulae]